MVFRSIANGKNFRCGNMKCKKCGEDIGAEMYLVENHLVSKRGMKMIIAKYFIGGCSETRSLKNAKAWKDYSIVMFTRLESEKRCKNYKIAKKLLKSDYKYVELLLKKNNMNL